MLLYISTGSCSDIDHHQVLNPLHHSHVMPRKQHIPFYLLHKFLKLSFAISCYFFLLCIQVFSPPVYTITLCYTDYCQQALEAKRNLGEDVTDILVSLSQAYAASGDSVMAEAILNQAG